MLSNSELDQLIDAFETLDLKECEDDKVYSIFRKFEELPIVAYEFEKEIPITRVRPNDGRIFTTKEKLWHPPDDKNKKYQRASNPSCNAFYGSIIPPEDKVKIITSSRIPTFMEVSELIFQEPEEINTEVLTFSKWVSNRNLNIVCVFDFENNVDDNRIINSCKKAYQQVIQDNPDKEYLIRTFTRFLATEFKKEASGLEYRISSIFSEIIFKGAGFDGILYPSFKTNFDGYNIAIRPEIVEQNFTLDSVVQTKHYRLKKYSLVNNELIAEEVAEDGSFEFEEIEDWTYRIPDKKIPTIMDANA